MIEIPAQNTYCVIQGKSPKRIPKEFDAVFGQSVSRAHCRGKEVARRFVDSDTEPVWIIGLYFCAN